MLKLVIGTVVLPFVGYFELLKLLRYGFIYPPKIGSPDPWIGWVVGG